MQGVGPVGERRARRKKWVVQAVGIWRAENVEIENYINAITLPKKVKPILQLANHCHPSFPTRNFVQPPATVGLGPDSPALHPV